MYFTGWNAAMRLGGSGGALTLTVALAMGPIHSAGAQACPPFATVSQEGCPLGINLAGCCDDGEVARWCQDGQLCQWDCPADSEEAKVCGGIFVDDDVWKVACMSVADQEANNPGGLGILSCEEVVGCPCSGIDCGYDPSGCFCGSCEPGQFCDTTAGECLCVPSCGGKQCGDDGCGGACGPCPDGLTCSAQWLCVEAECVPDCSGKQCGPDQCTGSCGVCDGGLVCTLDGHCEARQGEPPEEEPCTCEGRQCGVDACGAPCGTCPVGQVCEASAGLCSDGATGLGSPAVDCGPGWRWNDWAQECALAEGEGAALAPDPESPDCSAGGQAPLPVLLWTLLAAWPLGWVRRSVSRAGTGP